MHPKTWLSIIGVGLALFWSQEAGTKPLPVVQIAIVEDGSSHVVPEFVSLVQQEIREVTSREFDVRFPDDLKLQGGWSAQGVKQVLDRALANPHVNLIIALGFLATSDVAQRTHLPKPVIAPVALDAYMQGLPLKKGASGVKNLHYLTSFKGFERNLTALKEVFPFTRLGVFADRMLLETIPSLESRLQQVAKQYGIQLRIVPIDTSAQTALSALPSDTEAVYVSMLPRLPPAEFDRLVAGLIERRLPSFSSVGQREVERGIAVAISPDVDVKKLARTVAANVHRILSGTDAGQIEVAFVRGEHLTINMAKVWANGLVVLIGAGLSLRFVLEGALGMPIAGSMLLFLFGAMLHLFSTTSIGILLATIARSMPQFGLLMIIVILPLQMLSGGYSPRESMPQIVQNMMLAAPTTHFTALAQAILYRGAGFDVVWPQLAAITGLGLVFFVVALLRFRASLAAQS